MTKGCRVRRDSIKLASVQRLMQDLKCSFIKIFIKFIKTSIYKNFLILHKNIYIKLSYLYKEYLKGSRGVSRLKMNDANR